MGKNSKKDNELKQSNDHSKLHVCRSEILHEVYCRENSKSGDFIVFIDHELDIDWSCDDVLSDLITEKAFSSRFAIILAGVAELEARVDSWPRELKLRSKRLVAEAVSAGLRADEDQSENALEIAKQFIDAKSVQVSRFWTLQGCLVVGTIAIVMATFEIVIRKWLAELVGHLPLVLSICFWAGCVGALLFVLLRLGKQPHVDSSSEKTLHYLEAVARIFGGGIAGLLVGCLVKLGLFFHVFANSNLETLATCTAALFAGSSEKLVAGMITQVEKQGTKD